MPLARLALCEARVKFGGIRDPEIVREELRCGVIDEVALVKHDHAVIQRDVLEAVRDAEHDAFVRARDVVHEVDDLVLALRIEAACHLVAQQQGRGADHLHRHREAALLPAREQRHAPVGDFVEADIGEHFCDARIEFLPALPGDAQSHRALDALLHREQLVRDAELRHVADFVRIEIAVRHHVAALPVNLAGAVFLDARDNLQQRALAAAGRPDDRRKMPVREVYGNLHEEELLLVTGLDGKRDVFEFEHGRGWGGGVLSWKNRALPNAQIMLYLQALLVHLASLHGTPSDQKTLLQPLAQDSRVDGSRPRGAALRRLHGREVVGELIPAQPGIPQTDRRAHLGASPGGSGDLADPFRHHGIFLRRARGTGRAGWEILRHQGRGRSRRVPPAERVADDFR